jgi:hypothetical protein
VFVKAARDGFQLLLNGDFIDVDSTETVADA